MILYSWKPAYELGIPRIDSEHRHFLDLLNELYAAMVRGEGETQLLATRSDLMRYVAHHFQGEEEFLASVDYPEVAGQRMQHQWFLHELESLALRDSGVSSAKLSLMRDWFVDHILGTDKQFSQWLTATQHTRPVALSE